MRLDPGAAGKARARVGTDAVLPVRIRYLKGLGPESERALAAIGIEDSAQLIGSDPFEVYKCLKTARPDTSLVFLYALIGAIEGVSWQQIARERRTEILMRLDDLGIAPK